MSRKEISGNPDARIHAIERLRNFRKVRRIVVFTAQGVDHFRVVVPDNDLAVNDELADLYWDIADRYPDYDFVIEPVPASCFDSLSIPDSAEEIPGGEDDRPKRRDIRTVAGAWKGHEELLEELRDIREDWE